MKILLQSGLLALAMSVACLADPATGSISGSVTIPSKPGGRIAVEKYVGTISGKVAPPPPPVAGVWLEGPGIVAPKSPQSVTLVQLGYQFGQSLTIVPRGTTVLFPNGDADYHNVFSLNRAAKFDLGRYKKDEEEVPSYTFGTCGLIRLQCEIHQHMKANVLVVESPYCALTGSDGKFSLTGLPPGTWTLRVQLDEKTQWHSIVTVKSGKVTTPELVPGAPVSNVKP